MSKVEKLRKEMVEIRQRLDEIANELDEIGFDLEVSKKPAQLVRSLSGAMERESIAFTVIARRTITETIQ